MSYDATGIEYFSIPDFKFAGGTTKDIKVAYSSFNPTSPKKALIPTCYGGRINTTLNFTSGALKDYNVIVIAMLGNGESSSPSNDDSFPKDYSLRYQVRHNHTCHAFRGHVLFLLAQNILTSSFYSSGLHKLSICSAYPTPWHQKLGSSHRVQHGSTAGILLGRDAWDRC